MCLPERQCVLRRDNVSYGQTMCLEAGGLEVGGLDARATDFESGSPLITLGV